MAKWKIDPKTVTEQIAAARLRTRFDDANQPKATAAYYDPKEGRIIVELNNDSDFRFSPLSVQELVGRSPKEIAQIEISPSGRTLRWKALDTDLSLPGLMMGVFGSQMWMEHLGRVGGQTRSRAKAAAARLNGVKGGRPVGSSSRVRVASAKKGGLTRELSSGATVGRSTPSKAVDKRFATRKLAKTTKAEKSITSRKK